MLARERVQLVALCVFGSVIIAYKNFRHFVDMNNSSFWSRHVLYESYICTRGLLKYRWVKFLM